MKLHTGSISAIEHSVTGEKLALLAVFARPEDEAFGPSGTLARYAGEGVRVSLVTAARELESIKRRRVTDPTLTMYDAQDLAREMLCSCRAAGIQRICLDHAVALSARPQTVVMQERLVRLIREMQPQVIVTYAPDGTSSAPDLLVVNLVAQRAFEMAGDVNAFPQHARDGLYAYQPQKLYYAVLPQSIIARWNLQGMRGVPDAQVTTILDVSPYSEMKLKAVYCQRHHSQDFAGWLQANAGMEWNEEHFILVASNVARRPRKEKDLFAGLR
ncbi:MAG: PIG-L family deacetylase [Chloroflexi bacterium]|nr:PIG-L family deacetylase [Chloroflexota bacterium]